MFKKVEKSMSIFRTYIENIKKTQTEPPEMKNIIFDIKKKKPTGRNYIDMKKVRSVLVWVLCKGEMKANCLGMKGGIGNSEQLQNTLRLCERTIIKRIILKGTPSLGLTQL